MVILRSKFRDLYGCDKKSLEMILACGEGSQLYPVTQQRAKPAVPFSGKYRLIDFALKNFINSRIYSIDVLTHFKSQSLAEHLQESWPFSSILREHFILPVPVKKRTGARWDMIWNRIKNVSSSMKNPTS
ncbi:MAG: sugar phosphate nucleotidyltransferase [Nitrospinaceae bacterium]